jgi:hypothetical protein
MYTGERWAPSAFAMAPEGSGQRKPPDGEVSFWPICAHRRRACKRSIGSRRRDVKDRGGARAQVTGFGQCPSLPQISKRWSRYRPAWSRPAVSWVPSQCSRAGCAVFRTLSPGPCQSPSGRFRALLRLEIGFSLEQRNLRLKQLHLLVDLSGLLRAVVDPQLDDLCGDRHDCLQDFDRQRGDG